MSTENSETATASVSRRAVIKTAAWAAPVIAVAVAAPLASASPSTATITALVGGNLVANPSGGTFSGRYQSAGMQISNVTGSWATGTLAVAYTLTGPVNTGLITKADGSLFVLGENLSEGGTVWTVSFIDSDTDGNVFAVQFTGQSVQVTSNTTVLAPPAIYSGTFTPGVPNNRQRVGATVSVSAQNVSNGQTFSNASTYP